MDSFEKQERRRAAHGRLRAQRQRVGQLRGRVIAISLIGFALLWGAVVAQMATGNDPVLGDKSTAVASSSATRRRQAERGTERATEREAVESAQAYELELAEIEAAEAALAEAEPEPVTTSQS